MVLACGVSALSESVFKGENGLLWVQLWLVTCGWYANRHDNYDHKWCL